MARAVRFRIIRNHPIIEPLAVDDGWEVSRVEWTGRGCVNVILINDPKQPS